VLIEQMHNAFTRLPLRFVALARVDSNVCVPLLPITGMTVSGSKNGPVSDPNIVPLIDVLLVLIIICHGDHPEGAHGITHPGSSASSPAIETRTSRAVYDRRAGVCKTESS
jgi:hypothetical protein